MWLSPYIHTIFQFPDVCDYHDAIYAVSILDNNRRILQTNDVIYDGDGPHNVAVEVRYGMEMNKIYTAVINVTTAVKSTTTEFIFGKHLIIILWQQLHQPVQSLQIPVLEYQLLNQA
jgi:hypothetical protein